MILLYYKFPTMAITQEELLQYRTTLQTIIDKYLPPEKRFSVENFSEEWLFDLASLLLEKDENKREKVWQQIKKKEDKAIQRFKKAEKAFLQESNIINKKVWEYTTVLNAMKENDNLMNQIFLDQKLDNQLDS